MRPVAAGAGAIACAGVHGGGAAGGGGTGDARVRQGAGDGDAGLRPALLRGPPVHFFCRVRRACAKRGPSARMTMPTLCPVHTYRSIYARLRRVCVLKQCSDTLNALLLFVSHFCEYLIVFVNAAGRRRGWRVLYTRI